jgi:ketosteroid isomerase-like protein
MKNLLKCISVICLIAAPNMVAATSASAAVGALPKSNSAELSEFRKQADALYRLKEKAFLAEDAEAIVNNFYTKDAISFGPEGKPTIGRNGFREDYKKVVKIATVKVEPVSTFVSGKAAWEWVNFRVYPKDKAQKPFTFIMLFVWAKVDGKWACAGDAYTIGEFPKKP